jgi:putative serine protease PepD
VWAWARASSCPAQQAGLRAGDVIVQLNTTPIADNIGLITALAPEKPGAQVRVSVVHPSGQHQTHTLTLGELPIGSTDE